MAFKKVASGATPLASDNTQITDALTGANDVGPLSLAPPIAAPSTAPTVAAGTSGNLNGSYGWLVTFVTGYVNSDQTLQIGPGETNGGPVSSSLTVTNLQANLTSIPTGPANTVARRIYRNKSGGTTYYLVTTINDNASTTYTDNTADASLSATTVPITNTTGTTLTFSNGWSAEDWIAWSFGDE